MRSSHSRDQNDDDEAEVCLKHLAAGLVDLHRDTRAGAIVDPGNLPLKLQEGMRVLSRMCLLNGVEDVGDSVHVLSDLARRLPVGEWGLPGFATPFPFAEVRLLTVDPIAPSEECRELAVEGQDDPWEDIHHRQLRDVVQRIRKDKQTAAYSLLREWVVRNPVYERAALSSFLDSRGLTIAEDCFRRWTVPIPIAAIGPNKSIKLCSNCSGLLYPDRDVRSFPDGRCRIGACREEVPSSKAGKIVSPCDGWRVFSNDILAYWVGPGLAEIKLHDELVEHGVEVELYPRDDRADVGRYAELGIDVKSYSCPRYLGEVLSRRLGGLSEFARRFVAIPDGMVNRRPGYLEDVREAYHGKQDVTFGKVSDIARLLCA
jgi:hypothetical protein